MPTCRRFASLLRFPLPLVLAVAVAAATGANADEPWPERVVRVEQLPFATPLKLKVPIPRAIDRSGTSQLVLHVHVDADGTPLRSRVEQSSGNPNIDEAVLHAVRTARFVPLQVDGVAQPVTLVLPMTVPFRERRR